MDKEKVDKIKQKMANNGINHREMNGETLRKLRLNLDVTQAEMAEKLGVSLAMYSLYERGKKPLSKPVEKLAQILSQSNL